MFKLAPWHARMAGLTGLWLLISPFLFNYSSVPMRVSDLISGILVLLFSAGSFRTQSLWPQWAMAAVALWLLAAPLFLWAPKVDAYLSDTAAGLLIMTFAVILPYRVPTGGPETLSDWSYNPSTWTQRMPIVVIGFIAYVAATHLAFFQLGYIQTVWDPFFGDGTKKVLTSDVSKAFPVSDAGLGALAYLLECLSGLIGDTRRWRTMPWMSMLFWVLVVPAGVVSVVLVMLQPIAVGAWCALCLLTATLTVVTIPPAMDEFALTVQFLLQRRREGKNVWKLFWQGEVEPGPPLPASSLPSAALDLSMPWNLVLSTLLGIALMVMPSQLGLTGSLANSHFMSGALVITFSIIGMSEIGRPFRLVNILFGLWVIAAPWVLPKGPSLSLWFDLALGVLVAALAIPRGAFRDKHGIWPHV